jgi:hypothetical protein
MYGQLRSVSGLAPYMEGRVVDLLHRDVQRALENQWYMARLDTKRWGGGEGEGKGGV